MDIKDNNGPWIFISHSLKDWGKVRNIRNILENEGAKPLLFFLKCLTEDAEIDDLIKREIKERNFFLLCESNNTGNSVWVRSEVEFVKTFEDKVFETIELDKELDSQIFKIKKLLKRATIFLSYAHPEEDIATQIREIFINHDYAVFRDNEQETIDDWAKNTENAIVESLEHGFFLIFISNRSLASDFVRKELNFAIQNSGEKRNNIIPILIENLGTMEPWLLFPKSMQEIQWFDFSSGDLTSNTKKLINDLKNRKMP